MGHIKGQLGRGGDWQRAFCLEDIIVPTGYEAAMVVGYGCKGGAGVRFVVWRRYLCSSGELVQANVICICTGCSPASAASALRFIFVALSQSRR